ncbi:hypothetical protein XELAEV_18027403mg [Xenopus laevis]|uniref:Uncharacterized protein n=1 Tax=Xenopus laevis TaxID=8355 RepID=A0A974CVE1_XENLA|nr:hypothetical protein XELAEV_18027403mg [Xenopus laevis]
MDINVRMTATTFMDNMEVGSGPTRSPSARGDESGSVPCRVAVWQGEKEDLEGGANVFRGDRGPRSCSHPLQLCFSLALRSYRQNYKSHHASVPSAGQLLRKRYRQWDAGTCSQLDAESRSSAGREPLQQ